MGAEQRTRRFLLTRLTEREAEPRFLHESLCMDARARDADGGLNLSTRRVSAAIVMRVPSRYFPPSSCIDGSCPFQICYRTPRYLYGKGSKGDPASCVDFAIDTPRSLRNASTPTLRLDSRQQETVKSQGHELQRRQTTVKFKSISVDVIS